MSVREEDKQKSSCSSRGLGLAAAAIGVGVGAAVYYFLSKRPENPDSEGSTSAGWRANRMQEPLNYEDDDQSSYTTISEHSTTDTSVEDTLDITVYSDSESESFEVEISSDESMYQGDNSGTFNSFDDSNSGDEVSSESDQSIDDPLELSSSSSNNTYERINLDDYEDVGDLIDNLDQGSFGYNGQSFPYTKIRDRSWTLEECAICFEVMLKDQSLFSLPCTHNFHVACIGPWLEQQQTCPVCRKPTQ